MLSLVRLRGIDLYYYSVDSLPGPQSRHCPVNVSFPAPRHQRTARSISCSSPSRRVSYKQPWRLPGDSALIAAPMPCGSHSWCSPWALQYRNNTIECKHAVNATPTPARYPRDDREDPPPEVMHSRQFIPSRLDTMDQSRNGRLNSTCACGPPLGWKSTKPLTSGATCLWSRFSGVVKVLYGYGW